MKLGEFFFVVLSACTIFAVTNLLSNEEIYLWQPVFAENLL